LNAQQGKQRGREKNPKMWYVETKMQMTFIVDMETGME
jgi:hypothetical protein